MKTFTKLTTLITLTFLLTLFSQTGWGQTLIISEVADPSDVYQARFVEIYNATGSSVDLSSGSWYLSKQANGSTWADIALTGTIASGATYILAYNSTNFNTEFGFNPDQVNGNINGNGDDGYFLYIGGNHSSGTLIDVYGVIDVDGTGEGWEYLDAIAERNSSVCSGSTTWTSSEWTITDPGSTSDANPGTHTCDCPSSNDNDSEANVPTGGQQAGGTISSLADTNPEAVNVFKFDIEDMGSGDTEDTKVTNIHIVPAASNTADWTDNIQGVTLNNGSAITIGSPTITDTYIDIPITSGNLDITDGGSETITLAVFLNTSNIADGDVLSFMIDASAHGFTADAAGSTFANTFTADVVSNDFTITVAATELRYATNASDANINTCMSPDVQVEATDINGNRDTDYSGTIGITSSGSLVGTPSVMASSGLATFSGANCIQHDVVGSGYNLTASDGSFTDVVSLSFDITDINACGLEEFNNGTTAPAGWTFTNIGGTYTTSTNYGNSSPSLKMDNTGDIIETATVTSPSQLSFWYKGQGTSDGSASLLVEGWDGSWNTIENITNLLTTGTTKTYNSGLSSYTIFRFSYTKSSGNLAFDDVDVTCGTCVLPTNDATNITFPTINTTSLDLSWVSGNGGNRIVVCRQGAAVSFTPSDNNTYTANSDYSAGAEVGTGGEGNKVIYNGSGSSTTVNGLLPGTAYYFKIYEYGCSAGAEMYYTTGTPAEAYETTLPENVSDFTLTCITNTTATLTWTLPAGGFDGILIAVRESTNAPSDPNCDGIWLTSSSTDFSTASTYCGNSTDSRYVYNATGTTVSITGLTSGADYVFKAYTYKGSVWSGGTQTANIAEISDVTSEKTTPSNPGSLDQDGLFPRLHQNPLSGLQQQ